jgi:hypothetical protein
MINIIIYAIKFQKIYGLDYTITLLMINYEI